MDFCQPTKQNNNCNDMRLTNDVWCGHVSIQFIAGYRIFFFVDETYVSGQFGFFLQVRKKTHWSVWSKHNKFELVSISKSGKVYQCPFRSSISFIHRINKYMFTVVIMMKHKKFRWNENKQKKNSWITNYTHTHWDTNKNNNTEYSMKQEASISPNDFRFLFNRNKWMDKRIEKFCFFFVGGGGWWWFQIQTINIFGHECCCCCW